MIKIPIENSAFSSSAAELNNQKAQFLAVDNGNAAFYDAFNIQANSYEDEIRAINGSISLKYTLTDFTDSAKLVPNALFFPDGYMNLIPKLVNNTKGLFFPTGTDSRYEQNIISNTEPSQGVNGAIDILINGITAGSIASLTTGTAIPAGTITGFVVTMASTVNLNPNDTIYISDATNSGIYKVTSVVANTSMTINSLIPSSVGIASAASVNNSVVGFTNSERNTLTTGTPYQEILTNLSSALLSYVNEWKTKITSENSNLALQNDDRSTQLAQNNAAIATNNSDLVTVNSWLALSNTGASGKYVNSGLAILQGLAPTRLTTISNRVAQITTALGQTSGQAVVQSGETYSTSIPGNTYYNRYKWIVIRLSKATGSLRRYYQSDQGISFLGTMQTDNTNLLGDYSNYFITKQIKFNDGSKIVHVSDVTGLTASNVITVVSETEPEITRTIVSVAGSTQLELNAPIPLTYTIKDLARVFKTL